MSATKAQSQKIFEKLKTKPANKVSILPWPLVPPRAIVAYTGKRYALTADRKIQRGPLFHLAYIFALTARQTTATSESTSRLFARRILIVCRPSLY